KVKAAIGQQSFLLYCQPMASLSGGPPHYEILLRIVDETGEPLSPAKFIDAAERYDLMPSIDEWVVKSSLEMLERHDISSVSPDSIWSINLSGQSLSSEKFKKFLLTTLSSVNLDNRQVCFEVTETAAIGQFDKAMALISAVKGVGASFSLDDFGSGLSSFSYLKEIPVEYLKIDGSFVKDIESNNVNFSMVKVMNSVGKLMGLTTIAEFVSSQQSMDMLESIGIDYAQGYFISEPLLLTAVLNELAQESARQCVKS
ncbi:EAL domain-containing protein, partial [Zhongshania sp.]